MSLLIVDARFMLAVPINRPSEEDPVDVLAQGVINVDDNAC